VHTQGALSKQAHTALAERDLRGLSLEAAAREWDFVALAAAHAAHPRRYEFAWAKISPKGQALQKWLKELDEWMEPLRLAVTGRPSVVHELETRLRFFNWREFKVALALA
jgi:hypothetical protein